MRVSQISSFYQSYPSAHPFLTLIKCNKGILRLAREESYDRRLLSIILLGPISIEKESSGV